MVFAVRSDMINVYAVQRRCSGVFVDGGFQNDSLNESHIFFGWWIHCADTICLLVRVCVGVWGCETMRGYNMIGGVGLKKCVGV